MVIFQSYVKLSCPLKLWKITVFSRNMCNFHRSGVQNPSVIPLHILWFVGIPRSWIIKIPRYIRVEQNPERIIIQPGF